MALLDLPHSATDFQYINPPIESMARYQQKPPHQSFRTGTQERMGALWAEIPLAKAKVEEISVMPENWDGYGAMQFSAETKDNALLALDIILAVAPMPDITPNPNGTISFEWESSYGVGHLEIGRTKYSFYIKPASGNPMFSDGLANQISSEIGDWVSSLLFPSQHSADTMTKICFVGYVRSTL